MGFDRKVFQAKADEFKTKVISLEKDSEHYLKLIISVLDAIVLPPGMSAVESSAELLTDLGESLEAVRAAYEDLRRVLAEP
jgi:hypothetical protein